jgi:putative membrane protein
MGLLFSFLVVALYQWTSLDFSLPWQPISVIGIAVAFYLGFKNNSSYDRTWEARKIWGAIVNDSRSLATALLSLPTGPDASALAARQKALIYRHLAWLIALKHALRETRSWEHKGDGSRLILTPTFANEVKRGLEAEIAQYLGPEEFQSYSGKSNLRTQLLLAQGKAVKTLQADGLLTDYQHVWIHQLISRLFEHQGMCERIKNFPLPRQYASTALWMTYVFCALIPFGLLDIFGPGSGGSTWYAAPFSGLVIWVFFLMERIGDYSENPFESEYNDVPISSIARAIEIDLREMIHDNDIPDPYPVENGFLL